MHKSQIFKQIILFFLAGVALAYYIDYQLTLFLLLFLVAVFFTATFFIKNIKLKIFFYSLISFFIAIFYYQQSWNNEIHNFYNKKVEIWGKIVDDVDKRQSYQNLLVKIEKVKYNNQIYKINDLLLIKTKLYPEYFYGDELYIQSKIQKAKNFETFNYYEFLARQNIYAIAYNAKITKIKSSYGNFIKYFIFKLKNIIESKLNYLYQEPYASFLAGILLGSRKGIPKELNQNFVKTGVSHIIAVSGYNISILIIAFTIIGKYLYLNRKHIILFTLFLIFLFTILTGASAAVVRASLMGSISLISKYFARKSNVFNVLLLTVFLMVLANPKILILDIGFQLSFLATIALIYLSPLLEDYFSFLPKTFALRESFTTTLSAIILTSPLLIYYFHQFSIIALLVNILILEFIPLAMATGFASLILALFSIFYLAKIFTFLTFLILKYIIFVINLGASWTYASVEVSMSKIILFFTYVFIFFFYLYLKNLKAKISVC